MAPLGSTSGAPRPSVADQPTQLSALIVGGGVSGIAAACRLQLDLGVHDFLICERASGLGGTWYNNRYPGVGCDVPTRLYSLSFAQRANWKHFFSLGPDIRDYLQSVARQFNLLGRTRLNTQVLRATWIPSQTHWHCITRDASGIEREHTARVLICGTGALSIPREPDTPGWKSFEGPLFHSAEWREDVDCKGKDVVVIGNGCSATQIIPVLAPHTKSLTQIVRTRHWIVPQLKSPFDNAACRWLERNIPGVVAFERGLLVVMLESMFVQALKHDGGPARRRFARLCHRYITECAPPEYHHLLLPDEKEIPVACKRRVFDAGYIPALGRENVELCGDQAKEIVADGVILESGRKLHADVIITANGFKTDGAMLMDITNGEGVTLAEHWKRAAGVPEAYRGTLVHGFPNMFLLFGPNTVTGHFSAIWTIERSVELMTSLLRPVFLRPASSAAAKACNGPLQRSAGRAVQVRRDAEEVEQVFIQESMKDLVFSAGCGAWYADPATGKVTAISPSLQTTYLVRTRFPVFADVRYTGLSSLQAWFSWRLSQRLGSLLRLGAVPDLRSDAEARRGFLLRLLRRLTWPAHLLADAAFGKMLRAASCAIDLILTWRFPPTYAQAQRLRAQGKYREVGTA